MKRNSTRNQVEQAIRNADKKLTAEEITIQIFGCDTPSSRRLVYKYLGELTNSNKIQKSRLGRSYVYSMSSDPILYDVCVVCSAVKLESDIIDGMCSICKEKLEQTHTSLNGHSQKLSKSSRKVDNAFRNAMDIPAKRIELTHTTQPTSTSPIYPYRGTNTNRVDILSKYLNERVKVSLKNSSTVLKGTLIHLEGDYAGIQTGNGPLDVSIDSIAAIGQWDDSPRYSARRM